MGKDGKILLPPKNYFNLLILDMAKVKIKSSLENPELHKNIHLLNDFFK